MFTRRRFLAGALLSLPGAKVLGGIVRMLPVREATYGLGAEGWPMVWITTFANGGVEAKWGDTPALVQRDVNDWWKVTAKYGELKCLKTRVRRSSPNTLDVDYVHMQSPDCILLDDFWNTGMPDGPFAPLAKDSRFVLI